MQLEISQRIYMDEGSMDEDSFAYDDTRARKAQAAIRTLLEHARGDALDDKPGRA